MDFRHSQRKCHAVGASAPTTRCFTQVSSALPVAAAYPKVSIVVPSVLKILVNSWPERSRTGMLFLKLVPSCLHRTLKSTLNHIADIGSDLRRHDVLLDHVLTFAETCTARRDHNRPLPAPIGRQTGTPLKNRRTGRACVGNDIRFFKRRNPNQMAARSTVPIPSFLQQRREQKSTVIGEKLCPPPTGRARGCPCHL